MSRQAAARVRALKEHDYDKYLELARNAKDDRLKELMKKTDDIIIELGLKVGFMFIHKCLWSGAINTKCLLRLTHL